MKRFFTACFFAGLLSNPLLAEEATLDRLTRNALAKLHNLELSEAAAKFDSLLLLAPNDPRGALLKSAHEYLIFIDDSRNEQTVKSLQKWIDKSIRLSEKKLARERGNAEYLNYLGLAYMYQAGLHAAQENYLRTFWYIRNGVKTLKRAVEIDSTHYDAYLGLGVFHYYADVMPKFIKTVSSFLGLEADRAAGLRELKLVQRKGRYLQEAGALALGDVYVKFEDKFEDALAIFRQVNERYPANVFYQLYLAQCYRRTGRPHKALETFEAMLRNRQNSKFPSMSRAGYYWTGELHYGLNDFKRAEAYYDTTISVFDQLEKGKYHWAYAYGCYKKGLCLELLGDRANAEVFYKKVRKKDNAAAHDLAKERLKKPLLAVDVALIKGRNFFRVKMYEESAQVLQEALAKTKAEDAEYPEKRKPELLYNLAKISYEKRAYDDAIEKFQAVIDAKKVEGEWLKPWARFRLGECFARIGNTAKAQEMYEKAHAYDDPDLRFEIKKKR